MKRIILSLSLLLSGISVIAQHEGFIQDGGLTIKTTSDFFRLQASNVQNTKKFLKDNQIDGSPYLDDEFNLGYIITNDANKYINIPLRYNIYNDEIEFKQMKEVFALDNPINYQEISIGKRVFIYCSISSGLNNNSIKSTYLEVLNPQNKILLLKRYRIQFISPTSAKGYVNAKPAEFKQEPVRYYLKLENNSAIEIRNLKSTLLLFGNKSREVEYFIKKEKLKLRNEEDLLIIVKYYNSLLL